MGDREAGTTERFARTRDIIIRTPSLEAARRFYETVLGFPITYESETLLGFETGAIKLYLELGPGHGPVFELLVPDVAKAKQALLAEGCTLVEEDASVPRCYLRDAFGLTFNVGKAPG